MDGKSGLTILILTFGFISTFVSADVYQCGDGKYQSTPCDMPSEPLDLSHVGSTISNDTSNLLTNTQSFDKSLIDKKEGITQYLHQKKINRDIHKLELKRKKVLAERDNQISKLRERSKRANNNLAGATWQQSLAQEMSAVTQQADTEVQSINSQIAMLKQKAP